MTVFTGLALHRILAAPRPLDTLRARERLTPHPVAYVAWSLWLIAAGVALPV